jgi:hypothetical protein
MDDVLERFSGHTGAVFSLGRFAILELQAGRQRLFLGKVGKCSVVLATLRGKIARFE